MSTHNIGFYEDLTKIIFELSSNIIKYAPYFFCCNVHKTRSLDRLMMVQFMFRGGAVAWWLTHQTPDPEVGGSSPTMVNVLCP